MMDTPIRIKTFRTKTLQEAIQKIREEFGPDASILETKAARFGIFGRSRIEVTASSTTHDGSEPRIDFDDADAAQNTPAQTEGLQDPLPSGVIPGDSHLDDMDDGAKDAPQSNPNSRSKTESVHSQLFKELTDAGIDQSIIAQWVNAIRDTVDPVSAKDIWSLRSVVRCWIRDLVHAAPRLSLEGSQQQVLALVGPGGSGKTTTLAKIAASLSMEHGVSVGVLSADTYRLGSNYLLQNYAEMLGWSFEIADSVDEVESCLSRLSHCRIVMVDTQGCSPEDADGIAKLNELLSTLKPTETHLVISSTCNTRSFLRYERGFECLSPNRLILTRLDEAGGLGPFFSCLQCSSTPVSYLANGQNIPADLIQATGTRLAQQIMASDD